MSPDDLRYFLAVRRARSIKGGARALGVDHVVTSEGARENARVRAVKDALVELIDADAHLLAGEGPT